MCRERAGKRSGRLVAITASLRSNTGPATPATFARTNSAGSVFIISINVEHAARVRAFLGVGPRTRRHSTAMPL